MIKPQSKNKRKSRARLIVLGGIALTIGFAAVGAHADEWDKKTVLTVSEPTQVRETLLEPGQYVFKLVDSSSDRHIVQIYNADQTHLINTIMAIPDYRLQPTSRSQFVMYETPEGSAKAIKAWFYPGDNFGQEFPYPKRLIVIAQSSTSSYTPPAAAAAPAPEAPAAEPQASVQEPPSPQPPIEIAQNSPPPAPEAPQTAAAPAPAELPKTASPYPIIGFTGLFLLGLGGLIRQTRAA